MGIITMYFTKKQNLKMKRSEEHTSELQSRENLVCRLLLEKTDIRAAEGCWQLHLCGKVGHQAQRHWGRRYRRRRGQRIRGALAVRSAAGVTNGHSLSLPSL